MLLEDGHTNVYGPEATADERLRLRTRMVDGRVLVVGTRDPHFDKQGLQVGDEVVAINGVPVREYAATRVLPYVSASSPQDRDVRAYDYGLLVGPVGSRLVLETVDAGGRPSSHTFVIEPSIESARSTFEFRMMAGVAYVALRSFEDETAAVEFEKHYREIARATAVVLDLRDNGGGSDDVGWRILSKFVDGPVNSLRSEFPQYVATALA